MTKEQAIEIINTMVDEKASLRVALHGYGIKPSDFYAYVWSDSYLTDLYVRAQSVKAELMVEDIIDISDNEIDASKARNRIDTRRWYAAKIQPNKYGERIDVNVNQVVSITDALADAKKRLLPNDASQHIIEGELVDTKQVSDQRTTDTQSVETLEIKTLDDILE